jgi:hypothetical protein
MSEEELERSIWKVQGAFEGVFEEHLERCSWSI